MIENIFSCFLKYIQHSECQYVWRICRNKPVYFHHLLGPLLPKWIDFNSSTNKWLHPLQIVASNYCPFPNAKAKFPLWRHQMETFSTLLVFCEGNHRPPVNSPIKRPIGRRALMFSLICSWTMDRANNRDAGDLRRHLTHRGVTVMLEWIDNVIPQFTGHVILQIFYWYLCGIVVPYGVINFGQHWFRQ